MTDIKATLIAHTEVNRFALEDLGYKAHLDDDPLLPLFSDTDADELAEFAGRTCYLSYGRPNPATRANEDYLGHVIDNGHESVIEHASATFHIHAPRSVLVELERHRHLSFSVVSQRYVEPISKIRLLHLPPAIEALSESDPVAYHEVMTEFDNVADSVKDAYEVAFEVLRERGVPLKQAREAARAVLPNALDTPMVVTGNMRAWKHVIRIRYHEAADAEIRELAGQILWQLREIAPNTFQDIPEEPFV